MAPTETDTMRPRVTSREPASSQGDRRPDPRASRLVRSRYDRIAPLYDLMEAAVEGAAFKGWRALLWSRVPRRGLGLEVGVGTGKNMPYYPKEARVVAVDLSARMLRSARRKVRRGLGPAHLARMDAQSLAFRDDAFDWAVATFVFCSVPDPVLGLAEVARVVRPGGAIYLLEHVRIDRPIVGTVMDLLNPVMVRITGANINRRTVRNVEAAGLTVEAVEDLGPMGVVKLITARAGPAADLP